MKNKLVLYLFPLLAFALVLITTLKNNLGVSADSVHFIEVARNIKEHHQVINAEGQVENHWPPGYPVLLAATSAISGLDSLDCGRYLNAVLIALCFFVFNLILIKKKVDTTIAVLINGCFLFSLPVSLFSEFWSENAFIVPLLVVFYYSIRWLETKEIYLIVLAGIFSSVMVLIRFAGLGFVGGILFYLLFLHRDKLKGRLYNIAVFVFSFCPLLLLWIVYTHTFNNKATTDRELVFHPIGFYRLRDMVAAFVSFILPLRIRYFALWDLIIMIPIVSFIMLKFSFLKSVAIKVYQENRDYLMLALSAAVCYVLFVFVVISFFDASTPLDNRMLSPTYPFLLLFLVPFAAGIFELRPLRQYFTVSMAVIVLGMFVFFVGFWSNFYFHGIQFTAVVWKDSQTIKNIKGRSGYIFTNAQEMLKINLPAKRAKEIGELPYTRSPLTLKKNDSLNQELSEMKSSIESGKGELAYFYNIDTVSYFPAKSEILKAFKNSDITYFDDGFIIRN